MTYAQTKRYNESVRVLAKDGREIGKAHFTGQAQQEYSRPISARIPGLWSWQGTLMPEDFDAGELMNEPMFNLEFSDGTTAEVLFRNASVPRGPIQITGNGNPPGVEI